ncbi:MAG: hypothetical protein Q8L23_09060 [Caulobacter sp.]|nr:hypothetical protein [Caulobacter sp.]
MLETLAALPPVHQAYLVMAMAGFVIFALTLGGVSTIVNLRD